MIISFVMIRLLLITYRLRHFHEESAGFSAKLALTLP